MKQSIRIVGSILLAAALSSPAWAKHHGGGGGGESQAGGLPGLEDRVEADEALITALQSQNNWAVINELAGVASVARSSSSPGPVTATQLGVGLAEVEFGKDVSGCAYEATVGGVGTTAPVQGQIQVFSDPTHVDGVDVQTFNAAGTAPQDNSFHLTVTCP
jgi:hypothetical protein